MINVILKNIQTLIQHTILSLELATYFLEPTGVQTVELVEPVESVQYLYDIDGILKKNISYLYSLFPTYPRFV